MPVQLPPGVYVERTSSGVQTITGVATSIAAFIGRARRGRENVPVRVQSFAEFDRELGGLWAESPMSYAVRQYFTNGGAEALVVRVHNGGAASTLTLPADFALVAASAGEWGELLRVRVDHDTEAPADTTLFNLTVKDPATGTVERFLGVSTDAEHERFVKTVIEQESSLVRVAGAVQAMRPDAHGAPPAGADPLDDDASSTRFNQDGHDGADIGDAQVSNAALESPKQGLWALERADLFNLLCIPPYTFTTDVSKATWDAAIALCKKRRAMLLVDAPASWTTAAQAVAGVEDVVTRDENAAIFFPRVRIPDPLEENRLETYAPCGVVAGVFARTDARGGVWKAPAGTETTLLGVSALTIDLTDGESGQLTEVGVNCLRSLPAVGRVTWGARTLRGADPLASEWKYIPVRRLALFIEESLLRGTQWVVFEPNDEPLWGQIRLEVGAFMQGLFRQGAFQGHSPREAYFVKCDRETTTQDHVDKGIVNIQVGFAPLEPAEFVVIQLQLMAGQVA